MKLTIQSSQKEALQKACIQMEYDLQFHEVDDKELLNAYVFNRGRDLTETQAFWLGCWFTSDLSAQIVGRREKIAPF